MSSPTSSLRRAFMSVLLLSLPAYAESSMQGIGNFYQVDDHVYRGAQPTSEGLQSLAKLGVKTVLDLREADSAAAIEERAVTALGMKFVNVPMSGLTPPTEAQITRVLALLEDAEAGPVFVHCRRGADRTGTVIAAYRIHHDHWQNDAALKEARADGMSFFQLPRQRYIRNFRPLTAPLVQAVDAKAPGKPAETNASREAALALPVLAVAP